MDKENLWQSLGQALVGQPSDFSHLPAQGLPHTIEHHGVAPLLLERLKRGLVTGLSPATEQDLKAAAQRQAANNLLLNHAAGEFFTLAAREQLPCLLMKGAAMANLHYPESRLRPRTDTDVYIDATARKEWVALLSSEGYRLSGHTSEQRAVKQFHAARHRLQGENFWFDIHFRLSNRAVFQHCLSFGQCRERHQPVPALGPQARALSNQDLFLHACIHRIAHGRNVERNRLIWLYDIHLLWSAMNADERQAVILLAVGEKVGYLCADALTVSADLFGTAIVASELQQLCSFMDSEPSAVLLKAGKAGWLWSDFLGTAGWRNKLSFVQELMSNRLRPN